MGGHRVQNKYTINFGKKIEEAMRRALSVGLAPASSPGRGASGGAEKFPMEDEALRNAKASPTRRGGTPSGVTERFFPLM